MKKNATTICLAFIGQGLFAQSSSLPIENLPVKNVLLNVSYIPAKSFTNLSYTGKDSVSTYGPRVASVPGFYISKTELTNKEYREFVFYVKDSIAHTLLKHFKKGTDKIDWKKKIDWNDNRLDPMMLSPDERIFGKKEIDPEKLKYEIDFFGQQATIGIYPDTLAWIRDFAYAYNEPLTKYFFSHPSYNNYPVVGISLKQAMAFCEWETAQINKSLKQGGSKYEIVLRLPTNNEWESATMNAKDTFSIFSGSNPYNCNFGLITDPNGFIIKNYKDDGYFYTAPVKSFRPGPYGLYDMKGNVSEWTSTSHDEINGIEVKPDKQENSFVVKGGGWDSTPFYLQPGVCQFYPADISKSFIGFRYVVFIKRK